VSLRRLKRQSRRNQGGERGEHLVSPHDTLKAPRRHVVGLGARLAAYLGKIAHNLLDKPNDDVYKPGVTRWRHARVWPS